jgi:hypothetical protein
MTTIENKTLSGGYWSRRRSALPADDQNSAQSLRPTFEGWGPRL